MALKYRIVPDESPENPREFMDCVGEILYGERSRYLLGDRTATTEEMQAIAEDENNIVLRVYAYIHSGVRLRTTPFSCPWDSGQSGIIWCSKERAIEEWGKDGKMTPEVQEKAEACLQSEVETFSAYLSGDVWGYVVEDEDGKVLDSCWGYYGYEDRKYCEEEAKAALAREERLRPLEYPREDYKN